jgi:hypothetical protein
MDLCLLMDVKYYYSTSFIQYFTKQIEQNYEPKKIDDCGLRKKMKKVGKTDNKI